MQFTNDNVKITNWISPPHSYHILGPLLIVVLSKILSLTFLHREAHQDMQLYASKARVHPIYNAGWDANMVSRKQNRKEKKLVLKYTIFSDTQASA